MAFILLILIVMFFLVRHAKNGDILHSIVDTAVAFGVMTVLLAEVLSLFSAYSTWPVFIAWLLIGGIWGYMARARIAQGFHQIIALARIRRPWYLYTGAGVILFCGIVTLLCALLYPPTVNYDSMTYHMPRVFFWLKNHSVHNYPTSIARQLFIGPYAEFCILQIQVLNFNNDVMSGLPQWAAYFVAIAATTGIARELGASGKWQMVVAVLTATVPLAILQASTTQNDLIVAAYICVTVYYVMRFKQHYQTDALIEWAIFTGGAGGLAVLTKNQSYVILAPFAIYCAACLLKRISFRKVVSAVGIVVACVIVLCLGFYVRNGMALNGDILAANAPEVDGMLAPDNRINTRLALLTVNLSYNLQSPIEPANSLISDVVTKILAKLQSPDQEWIAELQSNYARTIGGTTYRYQSHDLKANPLHYILSIITFVAFAFHMIISRGKSRDLCGFVITLAGVYLLISSTVMWSSSTPRYMLPCLLLSLPLSIAFFSRFKVGRPVLLITLALSIYLSGGSLFFNQHQPLLKNPAFANAQFSYPSHIPLKTEPRRNTRYQLMYLSSASTIDNFHAIAEVSGIQSVGVYQPVSSSIYPMLYPFRDDRYDVRYVDINREAAGQPTSLLMPALYDPSFAPDIIVGVPLTSGEEGITHKDFHGARYYPTLGDPCFIGTTTMVFIREDFLQDRTVLWALVEEYKIRHLQGGE